MSVDTDMGFLSIYGEPEDHIHVTDCESSSGERFVLIDYEADIENGSVSPSDSTLMFWLIMGNECDDQ